MKKVMAINKKRADFIKDLEQLIKQAKFHI